MRLTENQIQLVKNTAQAAWGQDVKVTLFGSRTDDTQRGGDLDLYIETQRPSLKTTLTCKVQLQSLLDMPVDLVVKTYGDQSPIAQIARSEGVLL